MQKRFLVGFGPSLNTCPRCALHLEQVTSVRTISGFAISSSRLPPTVRAVFLRRAVFGSLVFFSVVRMVKWLVVVVVVVAEWQRSAEGKNNRV